MHPKVLLIGTSPYSTSGTSRAFDAYFHFWERDRVAQIFSRNWVPNKGHCGELYQITDARILKRWFHKSQETGTIYYYDDLDEQKGNTEINNGATLGHLYRLGAKHSPLIEVMRALLWRKKFWCTPLLNEWLEEFNPDCIVYSFSNHLFFQQVALYAADRFNVPIVTIIGDDFYFNDKKSFSPAYLLFRARFKKLTEKILFRQNSSALYGCDKVRDKYNEYFHMNGRTVYFNSMVERRAFRPIRTNDPKIVYFGSIRLGRSYALLDIAEALGKINTSYKVEVYSAETDDSIIGKLRTHPNVDYGGSIPYAVVQNKIAECDIYIIAEGFREEDVNLTRYSLSTKTSDSLACGAAVFMYGPEEAGVVDYLKRNNACMVCTNRALLKDELEKLLVDCELQKYYYDRAAIVSSRNHRVESSTATFETVLSEAISKRRQED